VEPAFSVPFFFLPCRICGLHPRSRGARCRSMGILPMRRVHIDSPADPRLEDRAMIVRLRSQCAKMRSYFCASPKAAELSSDGGPKGFSIERSIGSSVKEPRSPADIAMLVKMPK